MRIDACFDSHVHWPATGESGTRLRLENLRAPGETKDLSLERTHGRGEWILGFGWDDNLWAEKPHRRFLDQRFESQPVAFTRCDGHALWVNTEALKRAGLWDDHMALVDGGRIERDPDGKPTGVLIDRAADLVSAKIPQPTPLEMRRHLLMGVKTFNEAGFTHIRDMTCTEAQWHEALNLDTSGLLTLAVEEYFRLQSAADLDRMIDLAARARREQSSNLRVKGLKLFLDGALGSEGAWLSRCYHGREHSGLRLWEADALREVLVRCWERNLEVALHSIGDETADWIVNLLQGLATENRSGSVHIEHAELMRPETVEKMRGFPIVCHLQPSHWLSDRRWLKEKIGDLAEHAFPWRQLQEVGVSFDFGSDAPIEPASISRTLQALRESADAGVPRLLGLPITYMSYGDPAWAPNSFTLLADEKPQQVVFRGEHLL